MRGKNFINGTTHYGCTGTTYPILTTYITRIPYSHRTGGSPTAASIYNGGGGVCISGLGGSGAPGAIYIEWYRSVDLQRRLNLGFA